jgi:hypothetical protein
LEKVNSEPRRVRRRREGEGGGRREEGEGGGRREEGEGDEDL